MLLRHSRNLANGKGQGVCAEEPFAQTDEWNQKNELKRVHDPVGQLDRRMVEAEHRCHDNAKQRGKPQCREDADRATKRQAQRQSSRRDALPEQIQHRPDKPPPQE